MTTRTRKPSPAEWLDLIASKAPSLRAAGVVSLELDGCIIELAPVQERYPEPKYTGEDEGILNPMDDPATYGQPEGWRPGFTLVDSFDDDEVAS